MALVPLGFEFSLTTPMPPQRILGCFFICNADKSIALFAVTGNKLIALEMAKFIFGNDAYLEPVYNDMFPDGYKHLEEFKREGVTQGYLSILGEITAYKTRTEIIDETLASLP